MQHEAVFVRAFERIDDRCIAQRAERRNDDRLRFAAREQRRTVRLRQDADFDRNRPNLAQVASVDPRLAVQHALADDLFLELAERRVDLARAELRRIAARELLYRVSSQRTDLRLALLFVGSPVGCTEIRFHQIADRRGQCLVLRNDRNFPTRLAGFGGEILDRLDRDLHRVVAEQHATEHLVFGQLLRFRLDHQHR